MRRLVPFSGVVALAALLVFGAARHGDTPRPAAAPRSSPQKPSELKIDSGELVSSSGMPIHVNRLEALVGGDQRQRTKNGQKAVVTILHGSALLTPAAITDLLNHHLAGGKVRGLAVTMDPGTVTISGKAKKGILVPFKVSGPVTATPDGRVKLQISDESLAHLPKGFSEMLGLDIDKVVPSNGSKGIEAQKDSILFDPDLLWGLPIHGRVGRAEVGKEGLVLTFVSEEHK
ncbi:MAG: hypothetical protein JO041_10135 [Acidobacteria bacterium]|nr:hypothetical protein [Acidobacteriota bacterium]